MLRLSSTHFAHWKACFCDRKKLDVLQAGVVAAFGLVRGSAQADMLQLSASDPFTPDLLAQVHDDTWHATKVVACLCFPSAGFVMCVLSCLGLLYKVKLQLDLAAIAMPVSSVD